MLPNVSEILAKITALEEELETALTQARVEFNYRYENARVKFEQEVLHEHRKFKQSLFQYFRETRLIIVCTAPVIYSLIIPFALIDLFVTVYQAVCFPIYDIPKVKRSAYLIFDRRHLAYLNSMEKFNCLYCSYANGVIAYVREIAGRTEQYWCPIKHARRILSPHTRYNRFLDFGDAITYRDEKEHLRRDFKDQASDERQV